MESSSRGTYARISDLSIGVIGLSYQEPYQKIDIATAHLRRRPHNQLPGAATSARKYAHDKSDDRLGYTLTAEGLRIAHIGLLRVEDMDLPLLPLSSHLISSPPLTVCMRKRAEYAVSLPGCPTLRSQCRGSALMSVYSYR